MNIGIEPLCSRHIGTSRDVARICIYVYMCARVRPRVRDGKPAEVVCGYFGDWFYRVGNGTRAQLLYARPSSPLPSPPLFLFLLDI